MSTRKIIGAALLLLAATVPLEGAKADAPGYEPRAPRHVRRAPAARAAAVEAYAVPVLVPPCEDVTTLLLSCVPRIELPVRPEDTDIQAAIATAPVPRTRPYRQLFSWD